MNGNSKSTSSTLKYKQNILKGRRFKDNMRTHITIHKTIQVSKQTARIAIEHDSTVKAHQAQGYKLSIHTRPV